jgi:hypothetical protein
MRDVTAPFRLAGDHFFDPEFDHEGMPVEFTLFFAYGAHSAQ